MTLHQRLPQLRATAGAAAHQHYIDASQLTEWPSERNRGILQQPLTGWRVCSPRRGTRCRQSQQPCARELAQRYAAAHLFEPTIGGAPVEPLAYLSRQRAPRQLRLLAEQIADAFEQLCAKLLATHHHYARVMEHDGGVQPPIYGT